MPATTAAVSHKGHFRRQPVVMPLNRGRTRRAATATGVGVGGCGVRLSTVRLLKHSRLSERTKYLLNPKKPRPPSPNETIVKSEDTKFVTVPLNGPTVTNDCHECSLTSLIEVDDYQLKEEEITIERKEIDSQEVALNLIPIEEVNVITWAEIRNNSGDTTDKQCTEEPATTFANTKSDTQKLTPIQLNNSLPCFTVRLITRRAIGSQSNSVIETDITKFQTSASTLTQPSASATANSVHCSVKASNNRIQRLTNNAAIQKLVSSKIHPITSTTSQLKRSASTSTRIQPLAHNLKAVPVPQYNSNSTETTVTMRVPSPLPTIHLPPNRCKQKRKQNLNEIMRTYKEQSPEKKQEKLPVFGAPEPSSENERELPVISVKRGHSNLKHVCKLCDKKFQSTKLLSEHQSTHLEIHRYKCTICEHSFFTQNTYRLHQELHQQEKTPPAAPEPFCPEKGRELPVFPVKPPRVRVYKHACKLCDKKFLSAKDLSDHENIHKGIRPYKCTTCNKAVYTQHAYRQHQELHQAEYKRPVCSQCGKSFLKAQYLLRHLLVTHAEAYNYLCSICAATFKSAASLQDHLKFTHGEKSKPCPKCPAKFTRPVQLKLHLSTVHQEDRLYVCHICGKRYKTKTYLNFHKKAHMENPPPKRKFKCRICGKEVTNHSRWKRHERTHDLHSAGKVFECKHCGGTFARPRYLKRHLASCKKHASDSSGEEEAEEQGQSSKESEEQGESSKES